MKVSQRAASLREVEHVTRAVDVHAHAELARDGEVVDGGEVVDLPDVVCWRIDLRGDVAFDEAHAIAEGPRALPRQRRELRLHQAERRRGGIASQEPRQQLRSEEAGIAGEEEEACHPVRLRMTQRRDRE